MPYVMFSQLSFLCFVIEFAIKNSDIMMYLILVGLALQTFFGS